MRGKGAVKPWAIALCIVPAIARADAGAGLTEKPWLALVPEVLYAVAALTAIATGSVLAWRAFNDQSGDGFGLRRSAGGFGGAGVGWRLSAPLARIVTGLVLVLLGVALAVSRVPPAAESASTKPSGIAAQRIEADDASRSLVKPGESKASAAVARPDKALPAQPTKAESAASGG